MSDHSFPSTHHLRRSPASRTRMHRSHHLQQHAHCVHRQQAACAVSGRQGCSCSPALPSRDLFQVSSAAACRPALSYAKCTQLRSCSPALWSTDLFPKPSARGCWGCALCCASVAAGTHLRSRRGACRRARNRICRSRPRLQPNNTGRKWKCCARCRTLTGSCADRQHANNSLLPYCMRSSAS